MEEPNVINASLIYDAAERLHGSDAVKNRIARAIRPIGAQKPAVGPAFTIRMSRSQNLRGDERDRVFDTYDNVPAGSVVVVQVVGDVGGAVIGDVIAHRLKRIGVLGLVVDGPVRDIIGNLKYGPPIWSSEVTMAGMVPGSIFVETGVEVVVGGVRVSPGDLVAADLDGVFLSPQAEYERLMSLAEEFLASEDKTHARVASGHSIVSSYPSKAKHPID